MYIAIYLMAELCLKCLAQNFSTVESCQLSYYKISHSRIAILVNFDISPLKYNVPRNATKAEWLLSDKNQEREEHIVLMSKDFPLSK